MKQFLKKSLETLINKRRLTLQDQTNKGSIVNLIEKLRPVQTDYELIRIGPNGDGGYLVPNDLDGVQACFSPGVDKISEFELWCMNHGMDVYMADKSVDKVNLDVPEGQYDFLRKYIGCINNEDYITLDEWVGTRVSDDDKNLLLQMDIEGAEYESFIAISDSLIQRFRIIIIEFHYLDKLWNNTFFHFAEIAFNKILQTHQCVHIHPNNCCGIESKYNVPIPRVAEFTFLRKDRISLSTEIKEFPHKLDFDNTNNAPIILPENWY